eukprot:GAHX01002377.1.p1 GENE.GAHX01002377.1~~GAHX01002377.1.p1  ORF type:complete len:446 (+),score=88.37 GAHX01002377.1:43-1380(+)
MTNFIFIIIQILLSHVLNYIEYSDIPTHVCIIDAGSSGYRINIFDIVRTVYSTSFVTRSKIVFQKVFHPITDDIDDPLQLQRALKQLTTNLNNALLKNNIRINSMIVSIIGTAGFRKAKYKISYDSFIRTLKDNLALFDYYSIDVHSITGYEEGFLLLKSVFFTESLFDTEIYTYGAWEIGGSSLQISMLLPTALVDKYKKLHIKEVVRQENCNIYKVPDFYFNFQSFHILACSFEEMGVNDIQSEVNKYLIETSKTEIVLNNCMNKGISYSSKVNNKDYNFKGDYDHEKCKLILKEVLTKLTNSNQSEIYYIAELNEALCNSTKKPHIHVLPVSNLKHIIDHLKVQSSKHLLKDLKENSKEFCLKPFEEVQKEYSEINENVLQKLCINSNYVIELLKVFYKMDVNIKNIMRFKKTESLEEMKVEWSLGAAYKYLLEYLYIQQIK